MASKKLEIEFFVEGAEGEGADFLRASHNTIVDSIMFFIVRCGHREIHLVPDPSFNKDFDKPMKYHWMDGEKIIATVLSTPA